MANPVGSLLVRIGADTGGLRKGGRRAETTMQAMSRQARRTAARLAKIGTAATAAGVAMTAALTKRGLESVDAQAKLARQLGGTADGLRGLQLAASDAGVESSALDKSMEKLNSRIGEARRGTGQAAASFERLGLDADNLARMDVDQRMAHIAGAMDGLGMSTDQAADELRQMGIRNTELVNMLADGGDAIRSARDEVDAYGLSLSAVDTAQVEAANDAMSRIGLIVEAVSNQLAVELSPILQGVAELFTDTAKETGGLGDGIRAAVDLGVSGFGAVADAVESVRRLIVSVRPAGKMMGAALVGVMADVASAILRGPTDALNGLIKIANSIPGVDIDVVEPPRIAQKMEHEANLARMEAAQAKQEINGIMSAPMPSTGMQEWVDNQREMSQQAAEEAVATEQDKQSRIAAIQRAAGSEGAARTQAQMESEQEQREKNLERVREYLQTEREAEIAAHEQRMEWLAQARENELITEQEFRRKKEELEEKHQANLTSAAMRGLSEREKFNRMSMDAQVAQVAGSLQSMTSSTASENKKMFEINKAAGIANAIVNTYQGISKSLSAYPMPLAGVMAAAHAAAGFAQVNAIKSQSFGGGGSAGGGGAPAQTGARSTQAGTGAGEQGGGGQQVSRSITIRGEGVSQEWIRDSLVPALNEAAGDGASFQG